jgi:hypothetical protein
MTERRENESAISAEEAPGSVQHERAGGDDFARQLAGRPRGSLVEYWEFLWSTKRWWLAPIVLALLLVGAFVLLSTTAVAPFIYTLF